MILWRISAYRDLSGLGGLLMEGRWHYAGQPVIYLAENPAAALLEVCVHTSAANVPPVFNLLRVEGRNVAIETISLPDLPEDWPSNFDSTRTLGTTWLRSRKSALLQVPNAIVPQTSNFLLNPLHPDAQSFGFVESIAYPFDVRIKR